MNSKWAVFFCNEHISVPYVEQFHLACSRSFPLIAFYHFEDHGWGYTVYQNGTASHKIDISYEEIGGDLKKLQAQSFESFGFTIQELLEIENSINRADVERFKLAMGFPEMSWLSYDYAVGDIEEDDDSGITVLQEPAPCSSVFPMEKRCRSSKDTPYYGSNDASGLTPFQAKGLSGFFDSLGKIVIPPVFQQVNYFSDGRAAFMRDNRWGYIDEEGSEAIEPSFDRIGIFAEGAALVNTELNSLLIDQSGQVLQKYECLFEEKPFLNCFVEGYAVVKVKGRYGLLSRNGAFALEPVYAAIGQVCNGFAVVYPKEMPSYFWRTDGTRMDAPRGYTIAGGFSEGLAPVSLDGDRHHVSFIDLNGDIVLENIPRLSFYQGFNSGLMPVLGAKKKYGYINTRGEVVIEQKFDVALPFVGDAALVKNRGKTTFIRPDGTPYFKPKELHNLSQWSFRLHSPFVALDIFNADYISKYTGELVFSSNSYHQ
ncbi:WG repeat-containing protein [Paenibacillus contaminans]|uniref:WG repeat-containing protein n=1 Tax=Paenibacillus contaminans TaxID=450362 RepID=UPI001314A906|nr:WG repeat-containing protein [Paenibacillus contaminans]